MLLLYHLHRSGDEWTCDKCNSAVCQKGTGYSNLVSRIRWKHKELIEEQLTKQKAKILSPFKLLTYDAQAQGIHAWIETIIMCMLPFSRESNYLKPFQSCQHPSKDLFEEHTSAYLSRRELDKQCALRRALHHLFWLIRELHALRWRHHVLPGALQQKLRNRSTQMLSNLEPGLTQCGWTLPLPVIHNFCVW